MVSVTDRMPAIAVGRRRNASERNENHGVASLILAWATPLSWGDSSLELAPLVLARLPSPDLVVATITLRRRLASRAPCHTRSSIGTPAIGASGLPGKRVAAKRAAMMPTADMAPA